MAGSECWLPEKEHRFRLYLRFDGSVWYTNCIDLCLDAEGDTPQEAMAKMDDALVGYLQTVLGQKLGSAFLRRPSSWDHHVWYYYIKVSCWLKSLVSGMNLPKECKTETYDRHVPVPSLVAA